MARENDLSTFTAVCALWAASNGILGRCVQTWTYFAPLEEILLEICALIVGLTRNPRPNVTPNPRLMQHHNVEEGPTGEEAVIDVSWIALDCIAQKASPILMLIFERLGFTESASCGVRFAHPNLGDSVPAADVF